MANPGKLIPIPTDETAEFWLGCSRRQLRIQRCNDCHQFQFPPQNFCRHCSGAKLAWTAASGRGKVLSRTIVHWSPNPAYAAESPYSLALIQLEEGPRMLSNLIGCPPDPIQIGMPVKVDFEQCGPEIMLPKFRPT
jgi:uncharacterized OB-fold protein